MDIYNSEIVTPKDMNLLSSHFYQEAEKMKAEFAILSSDFEAFKSEMRIEMAQFREEIRSDIAKFKEEIQKEMTQMRHDITSLQHELKSMENRIIIKFGIMMVASMGFFEYFFKN